MMTKIENSAVMTKKSDSTNPNKKEGFPFGLGRLPVDFEEAIRELNKMYNTPMEFMMTAFLNQIGAALGKMIAVTDYGGANEADARLWTLNIGISNSGKTPAAIKSGLYGIIEKQRGFIEEKDDTRILTTDINLSALAYHTSKNNTLLCYFDEMEDFLKNHKDEISGFMSYSMRGNVQSRLRKVVESDISINPFTTIHSNTQPSKIFRLIENGRGEDGFIQRFLLCFPDYKRQRKPIEILKPERNAGEISKKYFDKIFHFSSNLEKVKTHRLSLKAHEIYIETFNDIMFNSDVSRETDDSARVSSLGKMDTYLLSFALIFEYLDAVENNKELNQIGKISAQSMIKSQSVVRYFVGELNKVHDVIESGGKVLSKKKQQVFNALPSSESEGDESYFTQKEAYHYIKSNKEKNGLATKVPSERTIASYCKEFFKLGYLEKVKYQKKGGKLREHYLKTIEKL